MSLREVFIEIVKGVAVMRLPPIFLGYWDIKAFCAREYCQRIHNNLTGIWHIAGVSSYLDAANKYRGDMFIFARVTNFGALIKANLYRIQYLNYCRLHYCIISDTLSAKIFVLTHIANWCF